MKKSRYSDEQVVRILRKQIGTRCLRWPRAWSVVTMCFAERRIP